MPGCALQWKLTAGPCRLGFVIDALALCSAVLTTNIQQHPVQAGETLVPCSCSSPTTNTAGGYSSIDLIPDLSRLVHLSAASGDKGLPGIRIMQWKVSAAASGSSFLS